MQFCYNRRYLIWNPRMQKCVILPLQGSGQQSHSSPWNNLVQPAADETDGPAAVAARTLTLHWQQEDFKCRFCSSSPSILLLLYSTVGRCKRNKVTLLHSKASCSKNVPGLCFRKNYRWNAIVPRWEKLMVKYMNNGMSAFSLVCIVKDDLFTLGYSAFPCEMRVLKVLKEREAVGRWRLQSGVGCSNPHDGGDLMSDFILIACSPRNSIYCSFVPCFQTNRIWNSTSLCCLLVVLGLMLPIKDSHSLSQSSCPILKPFVTKILKKTIP